MNDHINELWNSISAVLCHHNQPGDAAIDTLNRLIRKVPQLSGRTDLPTLTEDTIGVKEEFWRMERLRALLTDKHITALQPSNTQLPIIVIRWQNTDYLIDGRRRINYWSRIDAAGPRTVLVVVVS